MALGDISAKKDRLGRVTASSVFEPTPESVIKPSTANCGAIGASRTINSIPANDFRLSCHIKPRAEPVKMAQFCRGAFEGGWYSGNLRAYGEGGSRVMTPPPPSEGASRSPNIS